MAIHSLGTQRWLQIEDKKWKEKVQMYVSRLDTDKILFGRIMR
jgi:hypothetical protein